MGDTEGLVGNKVTREDTRGLGGYRGTRGALKGIQEGLKEYEHMDRETRWDTGRQGGIQGD